MTSGLTSTLAPSQNSSAAGAGLSVLGKQLLEDALNPIKDDLTQLNLQIFDFIPTETSTARAVLDHIFAAGGKRIRPALYFYCCQLFDYRGEHYLPMAAVCEFVHTASLLHDDVVDNSTLRRNKPTANSIWGDQASVLVGDLIYARASELMAATGSLDIVGTFARAIRLMSEGELYQLEGSFRFGASHEQYFRVLQCKTAALIAAACQAPAYLVDAPRAAADALAEFGEAIGLAFQLVDDALDYLGSRELFGKPTLSDLRDGKVTLPVLLLRDQATPEEIAWLQSGLQESPIADATIQRLAHLVHHYQTAEKTIELAGTYTDKALAALNYFPPGKARDQLESLAKRLVWRLN